MPPHMNSLQRSRKTEATDSRLDKIKQTHVKTTFPSRGVVKTKATDKRLDKIQQAHVKASSPPEEAGRLKLQTKDWIKSTDPQELYFAHQFPFHPVSSVGAMKVRATPPLSLARVTRRPSN